MKLNKIEHKSHHSTVIFGAFIIGLFISLTIPNALSTSVLADTDTTVSQPFTGLTVDITINANISGDLTINSMTTAPDSPTGMTIIGTHFNITFVPDNSSETLGINSTNITITLTLELIAALGGVDFNTIQIYHYNTETSTWEALETNLVNNSFVATVTSLSYFGLFTKTLGVNLDTIILVAILVALGVILSFSPSLVKSRREEVTSSKVVKKKKSADSYKLFF